MSTRIEQMFAAALGAASAAAQILPWRALATLAATLLAGVASVGRATSFPPCLPAGEERWRPAVFNADKTELRIYLGAEARFCAPPCEALARLAPDDQLEEGGDYVLLNLQGMGIIPYLPHVPYVHEGPWLPTLYRVQPVHHDDAPAFPDYNVVEVRQSAGGREVAAAVAGRVHFWALLESSADRGDILWGGLSSIQLQRDAGQPSGELSVTFFARPCRRG